MAGFRKAKAEQAALKMGLYGASGSGKTFTALLLAEGLAALSGKRVAVVDTEHGTDFYCQAVAAREVHPAAFDFDAIYTRSLMETAAAVRGLDPSEYGVIVIDSITHLWEAAQAAYSGNLNRAGQIPFHAWGKIKKPYKDFIAFLLSSPMHVIICGRQGLIWEEDDNTGELKNTGTKMKAEGETPYEPHILIHMEAVRNKKGGPAVITAFGEKDRTGILAGKAYQWPTFDVLIKPLLPLLGHTQAQVETLDETATRDAEAIAAEDQAKIEASEKTLKDFSARLDLCESREAVEAIAKQITPKVKRGMTTSHIAKLKEKYLQSLQGFRTARSTPEDESE